MEKLTNNSAVSPKPDVIGNDEGVALIKSFLKDMTTTEQTFVDSLSPAKMPLQQAVLKSLFETSLAFSEISSRRDVLRAAYQHLSNLQTMSQALQDSIQRHWGFHRLIKPSDESAWIELHCFMFDEEQLFDIRVSEEVLGQYGIDLSELKLPDEGSMTLSDSMHEKLYEHGVVSHLCVTYPRSDRYGIPEEATHNGGLRWLWNMGFHVSPDLTVSAEDSGCDGMASAKIRIHVGPDLLKEILQEEV